MTLSAPRLAAVPDDDDARDARVSDDRLMVLAAAGHAQAFETLVRRHQGAVRRLCLVILRDEALANDVGQETFARVWATRHRYRPEGRFREYLFTLARNESRRVGRRRGLMGLFGLRPSVEPTVESIAAEGLEQEQLRLLVASSVARLPEKFRVPVVLRFVDKLSYDEIAAIIGRTPSAARSRVHYGLKALADLIPPEVQP